MVRRAAELNQPPFALIETYHEGPLAQRASYASDGGGDVVVTSIKLAEDRDAWVVRAYETSGRAATARIQVLDTTVEASFGPHQLKTLVVPHDGSRPRASRPRAGRAVRGTTAAPGPCTRSRRPPRAPAGRATPTPGSSRR